LKPQAVINAVILMVVILAVASALYPILQGYITNITGTYPAGTGILVVVSTLYWILIAAGLVLYMMKSFGVHLGGKQD